MDAVRAVAALLPTGFLCLCGLAWLTWWTGRLAIRHWPIAEGGL